MRALPGVMRCTSRLPAIRAPVPPSCRKRPSAEAEGARIETWRLPVKAKADHGTAAMSIRCNGCSLLRTRSEPPCEGFSGRLMVRRLRTR